MEDPKGRLSVKEAAERLGMDTSTVYRLCQQRKIRHRRIGAAGGRIAFTLEDVDTYLDSCIVPIGEPEPLKGPPATDLLYFKPQGWKKP